MSLIAVIIDTSGKL